MPLKVLLMTLERLVPLASALLNSALPHWATQLPLKVTPVSTGLLLPLRWPLLNKPPPAQP